MWTKLLGIQRICQPLKSFEKFQKFWKRSWRWNGSGVLRCLSCSKLSRWQTQVRVCQLKSSKFSDHKYHIKMLRIFFLFFIKLNSNISFKETFIMSHSNPRLNHKWPAQQSFSSKFSYLCMPSFVNNILWVSNFQDSFFFNLWCQNCHKILQNNT